MTVSDDITGRMYQHLCFHWLWGLPYPCIIQNLSCGICTFSGMRYPVTLTLCVTLVSHSVMVLVAVPYFILPTHEFLHCCGGILYVETFERDDVLLNIMVTWVFYDSLIFVCVHHLYGVFLWNYDLITLVGGLLFYWRPIDLFPTFSSLCLLNRCEKTHILFVWICGITFVFDRLSYGILSQTRCATKATIYISLSNMSRVESLFATTPSCFERLQIE